VRRRRHDRERGDVRLGLDRRVLRRRGRRARHCRPPSSPTRSIQGARVGTRHRVILVHAFGTLEAARRDATYQVATPEASRRAVLEATTRAWADDAEEVVWATASHVSGATARAHRPSEASRAASHVHAPHGDISEPHVRLQRLRERGPSARLLSRPGNMKARVRHRGVWSRGAHPPFFRRLESQVMRSSSAWIPLALVMWFVAYHVPALCFPAW